MLLRSVTCLVLLLLDLVLLRSVVLTQDGRPHAHALLNACDLFHVALSRGNVSCGCLNASAVVDEGGRGRCRGVKLAHLVVGLV